MLHRFPIRRSASIAVLAAIALLVLVPSALACSSPGVSRSYVSGVGDDANPCSRTAPCKTFAGALSKTEPEGAIDVLDSAGYGAVTITCSITIDANSVEAGVLVSGTNGIVVAAAATDDVILRNIDFQGLGTSLSGVRVLSANKVDIDDSRIAGFTTGAVNVDPSTSATVVVDDTTITNNTGYGIKVAPVGAGITANVLVQDSTITNSATAVSADSGASVTLVRDTIFDNALGMERLDTGTIDYADANYIFGNTDDGFPPPPPVVVDPTPPASTSTTPADTTPQTPASTTTTTPPAPAKPVKTLSFGAATTVKAHIKHAVTLHFTSTKAQRVTITIKLGKKVVATIHLKAKRGRNTISWNGRIGKKFASAGSYRVTIQAGTSTSTSTVKLAKH